MHTTGYDIYAQPSQLRALFSSAIAFDYIGKVISSTKMRWRANTSDIRSGFWIDDEYNSLLADFIFPYVNMNR